MSVTENSVFSCTIFHCDYYLSKPLEVYDASFSDLQGKAAKYCPVIRLFGNVQNGEKCCVHIHGVFPYLLISSNGPRTSITHQYLHHLTKSIDQALRVSFGAARDVCYVFKVSAVEAKSIYGYHSENEVFLKIFLYNPVLIKRLAELLLSGAILNQVSQPYEAHVPYILQFFIDYNLHGMNSLYLQAFKRRRKQGDDHSVSLSPNIFSTDESSHHAISPVSVCSWEIDTVAADILNPTLSVDPNSLSTNPGISALWEEEERRRHRLGLEDDLAPQPSGERMYGRVLPCEQDLLAELQAHVSTLADSSQLRPRVATQLSDLVCAVDPVDPQTATTVDGEISEEEDVNEDVIHETLQMSQRLSSDAINQSSGEDLLALLLQLAASQTSSTSTTREKTKMVNEVSSSTSVVEFLSQSIQDVGNSTIAASCDTSLFGDSQLMPELAEMIDNVSAKVEQCSSNVFNSLSVANSSCVSFGGPSSLVPGLNMPSQTPPTPDSPKRKSDKSFTLKELNNMPVLNKPSLAALLDATMSPDSVAELDQLNPDQEGAILQKIVQEQEDEYESLLMSQVVWDPEDDDEDLEPNDILNEPTLPQMDGSNDDRRKKLSLNKKRLGTSLHQLVRKSSIFDPSLVHSAQPEVVSTSSASSNLSSKRESEQDKSKQQDREIHFSERHSSPPNSYKLVSPEGKPELMECCLELSPLKLPVKRKKQSSHCSSSGQRLRKSPPKMSGEEMSAESTSDNLLWRLLNSTLNAPEERKAEIRSVLEDIDKSFTEEEDSELVSTRQSLFEPTESPIGIPLSREPEIEEDMLDISPDRAQQKVTLTSPHHTPIRNPCLTEPIITESKEIDRWQISKPLNRSPQPHCQSSDRTSSTPKYDCSELVDPASQIDVPEIMRSIDIVPQVSVQNTSAIDVPETMSYKKIVPQATVHEARAIDVPEFKVPQVRDRKVQTPKARLSGKERAMDVHPGPSSASDPVVCIQPVLSAPSLRDLLSEEERVPVCHYREAFYSNPEHRQPPIKVGNKTLLVPVNLPSTCKEFKPPCFEYSVRSNMAESGILHWEAVFDALLPETNPTVQTSSCILLPVKPPPSRSQLMNESELHAKKSLLSAPKKSIASTPCTPSSNDTILIDGPTPANTFGFKMTPASSSDRDSQIYGVQNLHLVAMSVEVHVRTFKDKRPNPDADPVLCLFYCIQNTNDTQGVPKIGMIALSDHPDLSRFATEDIAVSCVPSEVDIFSSLCSLMETHNPDVLVGFEVEQSSWGYLSERAAALDLNLRQLLSRTPELDKNKYDKAKKNSSPSNHPSAFEVVGRCVINLWRIVRSEIALNIYTFENIAYHVLHQRLPQVSHEALTRWFDSGEPRLKWHVADHYIRRCTANLEIMDKFNLLGRTSEFAKLYGILFSEVLSRGSQFRVESMLLRLAHAQGFVAASPGIQQRARMAAPESLPLILEPESRFYTDPVVVLDFQSLYPSIIIAHNYCFSTCLGRLQHVKSLSKEYKFGATSMTLPSDLLQLVSDDLVTVSPNEVVFVKPTVRKGIIPEMLQEILETRVMVKKSMKMHRDNKRLQRILDARQMGLKLISNVTYGYTGAHFSGRMPCVEVADSIVSKARQTLDRAIRLVNSTKKWNAKVVYGDTDSLFILLKGATKDQAFKIGREIVDQVTAANPKPVKLKFEKVYLPCVLQTKKRYVGFMYETEDQKEPAFDAKGIETVRRDSCLAVPKILEKTIKLLFTSKDVSKCKSYVQMQLQKLTEGRVALSDYTIAKEYRGESSYRPTACVPALALARQAMSRDPRAEPRVGERVPYVVVYDTPGLPLIKLIRRPEDYLSNPGCRLNATYYATKQILPALNRVLSLLGANVLEWYKELTKVSRVNAPVTNPKLKGTLGDYFASMHCPLCGSLTGKKICESCEQDDQSLVVRSMEVIRRSQKRLAELNYICQVCCGHVEADIVHSCSSLFCPVFNKKVGCHRSSQSARLEEALVEFEQW